MRVLIIILVNLFYVTCHAQLVEGDILFVAFNTDGTDGFSIVGLEDIPANTTIYFNDNEWNELSIGGGGAFLSTTESEFTWTSPASVISSGTTINFSGTTASQGVLSGGTISFANTNEVLYAFLGSDNVTPTTFLSAIGNSGFNTSNGAITNTGLTAGTNATEFTGSEDVMIYSGSTTCNSTKAVCATMITNTGNWSTEDGSGDQSQDAVAPDFPDDVPSSFVGTLLPVELIAFSGVSEQNNVILSWVTASEKNNLGFEIQKSLDGHSFFTLGFVEGNGTSDQVLSYQFKEVNFYQSSYYRLSQIDMDGKTHFSHIIHLEKREGDQFKIYPNPFWNDVTISSPVAYFDIKIFDFTGKLLVSQVSDAMKLKQLLVSLTPGAYLLKTDDRHFSVTHKFIKQ